MKRAGPKLKHLLTDARQNNYSEKSLRIHLETSDLEPVFALIKF